MSHLVSQIRRPTLISDNTLHVVGVLFNPMRYHSRYRLFREWYEEMTKTPNVVTYVVELAFGDRQFEIAEDGNARHLMLRTDQEIWHKESLINLGVRYLLPHEWKYLCWSDADVFWQDPHWAQEAMHQMQHYSLIQPWRDCLDLGFYGTVTQHFQSFCYVHRAGIKKQRYPGEPYKYAHTGFAWACTRAFWEAVGGLMHFPVLGSADHHMAWASIGDVKSSVHGKMTDGFKEMALDWERKAFDFTKGNLGFVPTRIEHKFHGPKAKRRYRERWQIFIDHAFDPKNDITYDERGLVRLKDKPHLLDACREYLAFRNEDEITE